MIKSKQTILNSSEIKSKINRISISIIEDFYNRKNITIVGFKKNGYIIGKLIKENIESNHPMNVRLHKIEVQKNKYIIYPELKKSHKQNIFLVDDVLKSGKTIIYGVGEILKYNIESLKTIILVNRNHHKFPIKADYVGLNLSTTLKEHIEVKLTKGKETAYLI
tara:strand:- start:528 stop:1019 length:492 start_codon:yes stop_codon:yes gene_type:complete